MSIEDSIVPHGFVRSLLLRLRASDMVRHGAIVFAAATALNMSGFLFHALMARSLGVADYGSLYTLVSVISIVGLPAGIVIPAIARFAAEFRATGDDGHLRALISTLLRTYGCIAVVYRYARGEPTRHVLLAALGMLAIFCAGGLGLFRILVLRFYECWLARRLRPHLIYCCSMASPWHCSRPRRCSAS